jgi:hypothetical protein
MRRASITDNHHQAGCLYRTRPTSINPHSVIISATFRSPPGRPNPSAGNAVGQQDVVNTTAEDGFRIPIGLKERNQSLLLMATPEERACGVVCVLRSSTPEPDSASGKTSSGTVNGRRRTRKLASFVSFAPTSLRVRMGASGMRRNPLKGAPWLAQPRVMLQVLEGVSGGAECLPEILWVDG